MRHIWLVGAEPPSGRACCRDDRQIRSLREPRGDLVMSARLAGGIIAAGEGSRLRQSGFAMPKPMVPIAGVPLIESVIRNFRAARIARSRSS
jgi:hypothetical protein